MENLEACFIEGYAYTEGWLKAEGSTFYCPYGPYDQNRRSAYIHGFSAGLADLRLADNLYYDDIIDNIPLCIPSVIEHQINVTDSKSIIWLF